MTVIVEQISLHHPKARALLRAAGDASDALYPPTSRHGLKPEDATTAVVLIAWREGEAVGCGMLRPLETGIVEIKRMFVIPQARRQGVAQHLLAELERTAATLGYSVIRLETGTLQPAAIALYRQAGYQPIPAYGDYVDDPVSVCFEKPIATS